MAGNQILGRQVKDGTITRADLNTTVPGGAVITKVIGINGLAVSASTGVDAGTGDVTLSADLTYLNTKYPGLEVSRNQNHVLAGPAVGNGNPSFRALVAGDIPAIAIAGVTGLQTSLNTKLDGFGSAGRLAKYTDADTLSNSLVFDNGVSVAVGHTSPTSALDVEGTLTLRAGTIANMIVPAVNVNGLSRSLRFTYNSSATTEGFVFSNIYNTTDLMFIAGSGNVGIGTVTPFYRLDVNGTGRFTGNVNFDANAILATAPSAGSHLTNKLYVDNKTWAISAVTGLQTSLDSKLTAPTSAGTNGQFVMFNGTTNVWTSLAISNITGLQTSLDAKLSGTGTTNRVAKYTASGTLGNSSVMYDDGTYIGIGITTPASMLDVNGTLTLRVGTIAHTIIPATSVNGTARSLRFTYNSSAVNEGFEFYNLNNSTSLVFMQGNGNVGVGTITPAYKLDVSGTGRFTGSVQFDSIPSCAVNASLGNHLVNLTTLLSYTSGIKYDTVKVRTVAMSNITLSGHQTIGGYTTSGSDRVLVMGQTTASQNGVYISGSGAWTRDTNFDTDTEIRGAIHSIQSGTYAGYKYINANTSAITVGTTAIVYTEFSSLVETDPVFTASPAGAITTTNITNWNNGATAFTWGNHASAGYALASSISGTTNRLAKFTAAGALGNSLIFDNATNVAIGHTSPATMLDVSGTLTLRVGTIAHTIIPAVSVNGTERTLRFTYNSTAVNEGFEFYNLNNSTSLVFMQGNGNVGVGTVTPAYKLDVSGTGRFTGTVTFGTDVNVLGKVRLNGSTGVDHQFVKFDGTNTVWAALNTGELQDKDDILMWGNYEGERGFQLYGDATKNYPTGIVFSNPDTGVVGFHAYKYIDTSIKKYGLTLGNDGKLYHQRLDGVKARILTTDDSLSGGGGGGTIYEGVNPIIVNGTKISIATASATQTGAVSATDWSVFNSKLSDGSLVKTGLNLQGYGHPTTNNESKLTFSRQEYPALLAEMYMGSTPFSSGTIEWGMNIVAKSDTKLRIGSVSGPLELFGNGIYLNNTKIVLPLGSSVSLNQRLVFKVIALSGGIYTLGLETA